MASEILASTNEDTKWVELGDIGEFAEGTVTKKFLREGFPLAVFRVDGDIFVTSDRCTHGAASLSEEGELNGHVIECAWHFGTFDIRSGAALTLPCRSSLPTFQTRIDGNRLLVSSKPNKRQDPETNRNSKS